jgi:hypothetical protein
MQQATHMDSTIPKMVLLQRQKIRQPSGIYKKGRLGGSVLRGSDDANATNSAQETIRQATMSNMQQATHMDSTIPKMVLLQRQKIRLANHQSLFLYEIWLAAAKSSFSRISGFFSLKLVLA